MGLDSYIDVPEIIEFDDDGRVTNFISKKEIAYWRKCWFLHKYLANEYLEIDPTEIEFNCVYIELTDSLLTGLHKAMCDEAYQQSLSFDEIEYYDVVDTDDIDELKKAIKFKTENPETKIYYHGWY
ncbi:hypothetical protein [Moraxella nonliquefaciens]|jgi:hypothetical protein|uniref:Uncharacterized protein n=1 Tax=Moraxella nonliquefaciens TaxID=478 RepID=A0A1B8PIC6_MORNO|nr:hypothetical protein [Moraxella nonliquefaciens]OBX49460.1 hypothetical protein A9Z60_03570 [Moraxella nonliquefaciens]DAN43412.1 MAG TPA: hypothetical protein [Caudoviricetes sp.]